MRKGLTSLYLVLVAAMLPAAGQVELACCAGWIALHGGDCCESGAYDAAARACCDGDSALENADHSRHLPLAMAAAAPAVRTSDRGSLRQNVRPASHRATGDVSPQLYYQHSALLI